MNTFTFTNKETYLAYRSEWKAKYKELSQQIRDYKFCRWYSSLGQERQTPDMDGRFNDLMAKYGNSVYYVYPLKKRATSMLEELKLAKVEAQRQYLLIK